MSGKAVRVQVTEKQKEQCDANGVECDLFYPGAPDVTVETTKDYLIAKLTVMSYKVVRKG